MRKIKLGQGVSTDAVLLMFIKLVTMALGLVVTRLLSEYLQVYDYGTYSQVLLVINTVATLTILGMMDGVNYFYCGEKDTDKRERCVSTIFALQCVVSTAAGIVVLCLTKPLCAYFDNPDVAELLIFAAVLPLLQNLLGMFQVLLVSVGKARMLAVRNLVVSLARLAAVIVVVQLVHNVAVVFAATLMLDLCQIVLFVWILRKNRCVIRLRDVDFRLFKIIFSYCAPMAVFTMVSALNRDLDKYLIAWVTDTQTLAVYTNASKKLPFDIVVSSFSTVLIPQMTQRISRREYEGAVQLYRSFLEIGYISTAVLCCTALTVAPQLMQLLYSEKYLAGLPVFCIYILVDMLLFTNITLVLSAAGKTRMLMAFGVGTLTANAGLNVLLYVWLGVTGPAVATLLVTAASGMILVVLGAKQLKTKPQALFDWRFLLHFAAEVAGLVAVFSCIRIWLTGYIQNYVWLLLIVGGGCGVCMLLLSGKRLLKAMKQINRIT